MAEINAQTLIGNDGVLQLDDAAIFDRLILRDGSDLVCVIHLGLRQTSKSQGILI